ncbi:hypothetical protein CTheo_2704 [Ceratobasidium theobromae]|uniref:Transmembrane protein n=1 Tax=Ceratobasidium theobromae TaxID=1582974 RepID=A0A5N5QQ06_9AGAM|nr:hypothetical protein CTheo_2704 [Ceratobasidium theobromae]
MSTATQTPSPHATFYRDTVPAMGPVFLIAFAVFMGLKLAQSRLAHEKFVLETKSRIMSLEQELETLRNTRLHSGAPGSATTGQSAGPKSWYTFWK